jgi:predicted protein tyrosine phosphatase
MPYIQNVSLDDIRKGHHIAVREGATLIQIVDPDMHFPIAHNQNFQNIYEFKFLDVEDDVHYTDAPTQEDADKLVEILQWALTNDRDTVVHCHAGICRSGAVCEVGVMLGFTDSGSFRIPNLLLKQRMMKTLGWAYDREADEQKQIAKVKVYD